jgi:hypothetical protein
MWVKALSSQCSVLSLQWGSENASKARRRPKGKPLCVFDRRWWVKGRGPARSATKQKRCHSELVEESPISRGPRSCEASQNLGPARRNGAAHGASARCVNHEPQAESTFRNARVWMWLSAAVCERLCSVIHLFLPRRHEDTKERQPFVPSWFDFTPSFPPAARCQFECRFSLALRQGMLAETVCRTREAPRKKGRGIALNARRLLIRSAAHVKKTADRAFEFLKVSPQPRLHLTSRRLGQCHLATAAVEGCSHGGSDGLAERRDGLALPPVGKGIGYPRHQAYFACFKCLPHRSNGPEIAPRNRVTRPPPSPKPGHPIPLMN